MACFAAALELSTTSKNHVDRPQAEDRLRNALSAAGPGIYTFSHHTTMSMTLCMYFGSCPAVLGALLHPSTKPKLSVQDINYKNSNGSSALFFAISNPRCMQILLEAGADPSIINNDGETVLWRCAQETQLESAAVVLKHCGAGCVHADPLMRLYQSCRTGQLAIKAQKKGVQLLTVLQPHLQQVSGKDPLVNARRLADSFPESAQSILAATRARKLVSLLEAALDEAKTLARHPNRRVCTPTFTFLSFEEFKAKQASTARQTSTAGAGSCRTPTVTSMSSSFDADSEVTAIPADLQLPSLCLLNA